MEPEFYNSLNWVLTTDPAESLFPYDTLTPPPGHADIWPDPQLELLLSANSYPIPEPPHQGLQEVDQSNSVQLYGGFFANHPDFEPGSDGGSQQSDEATFPPANTNPPKRVSKSDSVKKRGRPRKIADDAGVNPEERRRVQVRLAQRAYRSRKEANVSSLKERINQLETAVKQMSTAVISFGDDIVRSGALDSHPDLLKPLGNTVQACLALPTLPHGDSDYQLDLPEPTPKGKKTQMLPAYPSPTSSETSETMEISEFIDRLHVTCSYQAYLVCANPAVPQRRLERPFGMLLSIMPRTFVAEYFKDWLLARAGHKSFAHWDHVPFFRIGGAGTHYPATGNTHYPFPSHSTAATVEGDASHFSSPEKDDLDDEWFDLGDLQGYLREKGVVFPASAPSINPLVQGEVGSTASSVACFIQALVRIAVCLGRSPGFRRREVENLVDQFVAKQQQLACLA
ncbi:hypothetical protein BJY04DRAFT_185025 [Aspergillus karnatakaensis]|uniref:bZIP transcription factor n=1 Tax=Aspergillus karnatakaensis TaxID=1810916 RepID=UPI003CCE5402